MDLVSPLSDLTDKQRKLSYLEIKGKITNTFGQKTLSATIPLSKLYSIYEVDLEVQRSLNPRNLAKMIDYINLYLDQHQPIYFPGIILSARGAGEVEEAQGIMRLHPVEKLFVIDGQHRLAAFIRTMEILQSSLSRAKEQSDQKRVSTLTEKLRKLYTFPLTTMVYLQISPQQEKQLFSDINKLPRKIGGNLALLRDQRRYYHVLASRMIETEPLFKNMEVDTFSERGKGEDFLFSYQTMVELLSALFEGRLKHAARNNGYHFTDEDLNRDARLASSYFRLLLNQLPVPFENPLCWTNEYQLGIALFLHDEAVKSGSFNKYALEYAGKILAHIDWEELQDELERESNSRSWRISHVQDYLKRFYKTNHALIS